MKRLTAHTIMALIGIAAAAIWIAAAQTIMPELEGRLFPVAEALAVAVSPADDNRSNVYGSMVKHRGSCEIQGIILTRVTQSGDFLGTVQYERNFRHAEQGVQSFGPWLVYAAPDIADSQLRAVAVHRCHPFWLTRTEFLNTSRG